MNPILKGFYANPSPEFSQATAIRSYFGGLVLFLFQSCIAAVTEHYLNNSRNLNTEVDTDNKRQGSHVRNFRHLLLARFLAMLFTYNIQKRRESQSLRHRWYDQSFPLPFQDFFLQSVAICSLFHLPSFPFQPTSFYLIWSLQ